MSKGKIRLNNYHHPYKYLVFDKGNNDNDAFPGQRKVCDIWDWNTDKGRANAKELVRRWNAFEKDGLVDELKKVLTSTLHSEFPLLLGLAKIEDEVTDGSINTINVEGRIQEIKAAVAKVS